MGKGTQSRAQCHTHVIGFDDAPFDRDSRGDVLVVGAAYARLRLVGVLSGKIRRDGANATKVLVEVLQRSRFAAQTHLILLQGIAFAGLNVVDLPGLHDALAIPVIAVTRRCPNLEAIRRALLTHVRGGARKWRLIEQAGPNRGHFTKAGGQQHNGGAALDRIPGSGRHCAWRNHAPGVAWAHVADRQAQ